MSDQSLVKTLNLLVDPRRRKTLKAGEPRGPIRGNRVAVDYTPVSKGGGIASPLNEVEGSREYYDPVLLPSTDAMAWILWKVIKKTEFTDANGATEERNWVNDNV